MAHVAQENALAARIDGALDAAHREWASVPSLAEEWPTWDEHSQFVFVLDWPVSEDRLWQLARWHEAGELSPEQGARYAALLELVERYRPTVDRLFGED